MAEMKKTKKDPVTEGVASVEKFLQKVGLEPAKFRLELEEKGNFGWRVKKGSAHVFIFVLGADETKVLRVLSPILKLPQENLLAFYRKLLETNLHLPGCCLGVKDDEIVVLSERLLARLSPADIEMTIDMLASVADGLDDDLSKEFGAPMLDSQPGT